MTAQEKLTVWWVKGYYKSEDDALHSGRSGNSRNRRPASRFELSSKAGLKESDIPKTWKLLVDSGATRSEPAYRKASGSRTFGIGQPLGVNSTDAFYSFLTFADAYNVKLVVDDGKLLVDDPKG